MRILYVAAALLCCVGPTWAQPQVLGPETELPYSACGNMETLRANLTGAPDPSLKSDAALHRLGVRCIGPAAPRSRDRY
jgi:hypothetical protein